MAPKIYFQPVNTPIGTLILQATHTHLLRVFLPNASYDEKFICTKIPLLVEAKQQLKDYFKGQRRTFSIPVMYQQTTFVSKVLVQLSTIPYGTTSSYKALAIALQQPKASRAIGYACGHNPLPIFIPCHRVIGMRGQLTGYRGGTHIKQFLLTLEKTFFNDSNQ